MDLDSDCGEILDDPELDSPDIEFTNDEIGFGHQKTIVFSKYLPYADRLDVESDKLLADIKANLGKAVLNRELKPGCYFWVYQLTWYMHQNGRRFTKEDHIVFIKLLYELVTIPDLEFFLVDNFARVLASLLKKRQLLSRKDLSLDWLPLYKLYMRSAYNKWERHGLNRIHTGCSTIVNHLIRACRVYFPVNASQEILEELRPLICPYITRQMGKFTELLELFLPTILYPEEHEQGFRLWFKELMQMWESVQMTPAWECNMVFLFSRLAESTIGYIDWTPYIPMIFTRLLRSFQLPLQMKHVRFQSNREHYNINAISTFIISMLAGNRVCQDHLSRLFTSLESFYHPSNNGSWNVRLQQFLAKLTEAFMRRLRFERRLFKTWEVEIPSSHRLTEDDITAFVNCLKPCVLLSMFAKSGCIDAGIALKNLAALRPELIIPAVLERFYPAIETLNEPHRFLAIVQCTNKILQPLVAGGKFNSEDPANVLPILTLCLPGIDSNDIQKTLVTFKLISSLVIMVPLVDCTPCLQDSNNLTEFERDLCSGTSQFEDFVLQFMDRCFLLVENASAAVSMTNDCTMEMINSEEEFVVSYMSFVFNLIMNQSSSEIRQLAIDKLCNFVTGRILGIKDSGYLAAKLVYAAASRTDAELLLKKMLNKICNVIDENCPENESDNCEADRDLLYNMLLLQELVCCDGRLLLPYRGTLLRTLRKIVRINDRDGRMIMCHVLKNVLRSLTTTYLLDQRSTNEPHGVCKDREVPIKLWGASMNIDDIKIDWHTGNDEEIEFAQELINEFLVAELNRLTSAMEGLQTLDREQLQKSLAIIHAILLGCLSRCPMWREGEVPLIESCTSVEFPSYIFHKQDAAMLDLKGENLRAKLLSWMHKFSEYVQVNHEDNIPAVSYIVKMYHHLMFFWGTHAETLRRDWKYWSSLCKSLNNPLKTKKHQFRFLFLQRVYFHHQMRVVECGFNRYSQLHHTTLLDLLKMSISHYSEVRCLAQWVLGECFLRLPFSYRKILPNLAELVDSVASLSHDKLKGLLHVILGEQHSYNLLARRDWEVLLKLWPVVIKTPISDRPSTNLLLEFICNRVSKNMDTFSITFEMPDRVLKVAELLWSGGSEPRPSFSMPTSADIADGLERMQRHNDINMQLYKQLVRQQVTLLETPQLHWQNFQLGCNMLVVLLRHDVEFPVEGVQLLLRCLTNDSPFVRDTALRAVGCVLYQLRPECVKMEIDTTSLTEIRNIVLYDDNCDWQAQEKDWDNVIFMDQPYLGFYCWQKSLKVHAPAAKQKFLSIDREALRDSEKLIYDTFTSETFLEQAMKYLSAEMSKEHDKLGLHKCIVYKYAFRIFEDAFVPYLMPHVQRLSASTVDSEKRCALELIAGMVAGSKHWKRHKLVKLQEVLTPVIKTALNNITIELQSDWCRAVCYMTENKDPRRNRWLIELLLENLLSLNNGSFVETNRLNLLCSTLSDQVWKVPQLRNRILQAVQPHLAHAYQNVRDELGRLLSLLFLTYGNVPPFPNGHKGPCQKTFVQHVLPQLEAFEKSLAQLVLPRMEGVSPATDDDHEHKAAVSLLKTICKWVRRRFTKSLQFVSPEIIQLLPVLFHGESYDKDPELRSAARVAIACIGYSYLSAEMVPTVLTNALQLSKSSSWRARKTSLEYLQILIFSNMFNILLFQNIVNEIKQVIIGLLHDVRPEVQQMAALTLSGLFHCQMLPVDKGVLDSFTSWSLTPIQKGRSAATSTSNGDAVRRRHAGILGMAAFINAHPYDIAQGMPDVLVALGRHLNDPQPIQTTVRFTITNFWRTHHDNWHDHKLKFTEDQLSDISDLLVSPNYYA